MTSRPPFTVVGIDLSLTSTGIARVVAGDITVQRITSKGHAGASLEDRHGRLHNLRLDIATAAHGADLVVIEAPAFSRSNPGMHDRSGLWWIVVDWLITSQPDGGWGMVVAEVAPTARAKYATGKGNAPKDAVLAAVVRRFPDVDVTGNDEADALVLAAMGARHLGHPIDTVPALNATALDKVRWPEVDVRVPA